MVRHGLMLVGQTVSGKTEVENALGLVERSLFRDIAVVWMVAG